MGCKDRVQKYVKNVHPEHAKCLPKTNTLISNVLKKKRLRLKLSLVAIFGKTNKRGASIPDSRVLVFLATHRFVQRVICLYYLLDYKKPRLIFAIEKRRFDK